MKRILLSILLLTASIVSIGAAQLTSSDPYWLGASSTYGTTEGHDFWLTFMNNAMFDPSASANANVKFELNVIVAARQQTTVVIEVGGEPVATIPVQPNQIETYNLASYSGDVYLYEINETLQEIKKGVHVYSTDGDFSCFSYSRVGEKGSSSRDASLIIPTEFLGKEYIVQTYPIDDKATEFAIVATEDNTVVNIVPSCDLFGGWPANNTYTINNLNRGDAYLLASKEHLDENIEVDLTGTQICSTKPIAVFNGNIQTKIDYAERNSEDHLIEQSLPINQLGTDFYLSLLDSTKTNRFRITATQPNTLVKYYYPDPSWYYEETLGIGESSDPIELSSEEGGALEVHIETDKPVIMYGYMTSGAENVYSQRINNKTNKFGFGDPANAMLPSWAHRANSMNFFIKELDPFKVPTNSVNTPQRFYAYVIIPTADKNKITLKSGDNTPVTVPAATFHEFDVNPNMSHGCISLPGAGYHLIESSGSGFVGYVYGISEAQGYFYTLGYTPDPFSDSLFVTNPENVMSKKSYDLPRIDQGWYQRQWNEWLVGHERLDTVVVCDSTIVNWLLQTPIAKQTDPVDWYIYDVTNTPQTIRKSYDNLVASNVNTTRDRETSTDWIYEWEHQFILPDESDLPPEDRIPFMDFEVHAVLHKQHLLCNIPDDYDTVRTVVRVTRIYHDTIYQYICMGDSYQFFNDSFPNQGDLTQKGTTKSATTFIADKTDGESAVDFQWKARLGENIYNREYQTIFGCDSTYTLFLFVCDTFRRVDTLHLCDNQSLTYENRKFKGVLSPETDGTTVTKDTLAIIYDKTKFCPCQNNPKYPHFDGCDSIFELHLMIHKTYRDTLVDTMCYNDKPDSAYHWPIQYSTRDSLITKNHPNMVYYDDQQAWVGYFSDTLQTQTCPECNNGNGCDSINILKLIIPKSYYIPAEDSICQWTYNKNTRTKTTNVYRWYYHRNGADYVDLPESGTYYDSCVTRYGCDSIYTLELKYTQPFLQVDQHVMATNQTYYWHGQTYGPFLEPEFKNLSDGDTTLYFHNDNENQVHPVNGCDSIYRLELTLMDTYLFRSYRTICDYDSIHWRDSIIVGSKWQGTDPFDIRLKKTTTHVFDSLKTVELPERDSVYQLTVTMWPSYEKYDTLYVCDNDSLQWEGQWYKGANGSLDDERHYDTKHHCDSAFYLHLLVKPSYHFPVEDSVVCQNDAFVWAQHTHIVIPTDQPGDFFYYDSCKTTTCPACEGGGCDSIYTLHLVVAPIHDIYEERTICASDSLHWQGLLFTGDEFVNYGGQFTPSEFRRVVENLPAGEHTDTAWYQTTYYGCDSIYHLTLYIHEVAHTDSLDSVCQGTPFFNPNWNWGQGRYMNTERVGTYTSVDTIHSLVTGCDSIVTLTLRVDSVYDYTQNLGAYCQDTIDKFREWIDSEGISHGFVLDVSTVGLHTLGEEHHTIHGCDSIYGVSWYVNPIYDFYETKDLCENDTLEWEGMLFVGSQYAAYGKTYDPAPYDSVRGPLSHGVHHENVYRKTTANCDSIFHLTLYIHEVAHTDSLDSVCQGTPFFNPNWNWGQGRYMNTDHVGTYTSVDTIHSLVTGCDSIVTLTLRVDSVYDYTQNLGAYCQDTIDKFREWIDSEGISHGFVLDVSTVGLHTLGEEHHTIHGCDSIYGVSWYVNPIYDFYETKDLCENDTLEWEGMLFVGSQYAAYGKTYDPAPYDSVRGPLSHGVHHENVYRKTTANCDSIFHLTLYIHEVAHTDSLDSVCQGTPFFNPNWNWGQGRYMNTERVGTYTSVDTIHSLVTGCDSIVTLTLRVDSVYDYTQNLGAYCQDTIDKFREWIDSEGISHGFVLDVSTVGLHTLGEEHHTIHGCDSIYGVSWYVNPIYDFYETKDLCENDTLEWEGMLFVGSQYAAYGKTYDPAPYDSVRGPLSHGVHHENVYRKTTANCDSIFHLTLYIHEVAHTDSLDSVCQGTPFFNPNWNWGQGRYMNTDHVGTYTSVDTIHSLVTGCDSIVTLTLRVDSVYNYTSQQVVCQEYGAEWIWYENGIPQDTISIDKGDTTFVLGRIYQTIHGCDSMYGKSVYVAPIYHIYDTLAICANDSLHWQGMLFTGDEYANYQKSYISSEFDSVKADLQANEYDYAIRRGTKAYDCDSVHHLHLTVHPVYRAETERRACQDAGTYFYEYLDNGVGGYLLAAHLSDSHDRNDTLHTALGCDSIVTLHFYVDSVYNYTRGEVVCQNPGQTWDWYEGGVLQKTISLDKGDTTWVLGTHYSTIHGCDSTYGISVYVAPIYHFYDTLNLCENDSLHWQGMLFTGSQYAAYGKSYDATPFDSVRADLAHGTYHVDINRPTIYSCDSTYHLTLYVHEVAHTDSLDSVCQGDLFFNPNWNWGQGMYMNTERVGTYTSVDTIHSRVTGCDSIVTLTLRVDSIYHYNIAYTFCQDTIDIMREWIDEEGKSHGFVLDISQPGDYRIDQEFTTIHGCDSTYGVMWHVDPIYRFDTIIDICENSRIEWQYTRFTGDSVYDTTPEDSIIWAPGTYHEFRHYETVAGCDSDYYATIHVHAVYDTLTRVEICESDGFVWHQTDYSGLGPFADTICRVAYCDTIELLPYQAIIPQPARDTTMRYAERMLVTSNGCDSLSRIWVTVKPTYFFLTDTTICANERVRYRDRYFAYKDTVYTDSLISSNGCDSIYQLRLHVRPIFLHTRRVTICDNDTLFHTSLNGQEIVWKPGDEVRDPEWEYYDMIYTDHNGCDSIYRYYITVHPSYLFLDATTLCSKDSVQLHSNRYVGENVVFPTDTYVEPYEVFYADTFQTVHGCDSIYGLYATIYPAYHHCDTIKICDDGEADWRAHHYEGNMFGNVPGDGLRPGNYVFYDSLLTSAHSCDSIYELQLIITSTYLEVDSITKCADEDLTWRDYNLDHVAVGEHFIYDSLFTRHGCDSVFHLYLTVLDTTREENFDTICYNDTLFVLNHQYRTAGDYKDTTLNEWGCHHFIYTHLEVIPPTIPTAWVDSMCKNEDAFDLYYTYTSHDPVAFSLYFDDLGHEMGFEDMIDIPITEYTDPMLITIPTPLRDGNKLNYPRPDIYGVHLVLDNGICRYPERDCYDDTTFVMSYPSWITEQRFGDVIALFNEKYNGGYYWDHYQWYHGDELLVGETHEYLYIPTGLIVGDQYHVRLTREGETADFQTCPITIVGDPIVNDFSPQMGYLSVVPTCIVTGHPYANILSRKDGAYTIYNSNGILIGEGAFRADVTQIELPAVTGMYIFRLWSPDTPEEPYRSIKVIVKEVCENCNMPF